MIFPVVDYCQRYNGHDGDGIHDTAFLELKYTVSLRKTECIGHGTAHYFDNSMKIHYRPWALLLLHTPNLSLHLGRTDNLATHEKRSTFYKASVRSLFSLAILEEMLRSMVRSATSTTRPPMISGLT